MLNEVEQLLESLSEAQQNAVKVIQTFIGIYSPANQGNGTGLFSGIKRYEALENRVPLAAMSSFSLFQFWGKLREKMLVGIPVSKSDKLLISLWNLPNQRQIIQSLRKESAEIIQIARAIQSSLSATKKAEWEAIKAENEALDKALENNVVFEAKAKEVPDDGFGDKEIPFGKKETKEGSLL